MEMMKRDKKRQAVVVAISVLAASVLIAPTEAANERDATAAESRKGRIGNSNKVFRPGAPAWIHHR